MTAPHAEVEARLERLEVKASYGEDLLDELNRLVIEQQCQIDALRHELLALRAQLPAADGAGFRSLREELPPHY